MPFEPGPLCGDDPAEGRALENVRDQLTVDAECIGARESPTESGEALAEPYHQLLAVVSSLSLLAGFCYTQFADTYQEANGLLYMDRTPKFPLEQIAVATRGARNPDEQAIEASWRGGPPQAQPKREKPKQRQRTR